MIKLDSKTRLFSDLEIDDAFRLSFSISGVIYRKVTQTLATVESVPDNSPMTCNAIGSAHRFSCGELVQLVTE